MGIYFGFEDLLKNLNPEKGEGAPLVVRTGLWGRGTSFEELGPVGLDYR